MDEQSKPQTEHISNRSPKEHQEHQKQKTQKKGRGRSRSPSRTRINGSSLDPNPNSPVTRSQSSKLKDVERVNLARESTVALIDHALANAAKNRPDDLSFNNSVRNLSDNLTRNNTIVNSSRSDETMISDHMRQTSINDTSKLKGHRSKGEKVPSKQPKESAGATAQLRKDTPRHLYGLDSDSTTESSLSYNRFMARTKVKKEPYFEEEDDEAQPLHWCSTLYSQMYSLMIHAVDPVRMQSAATIFGVVALGMFVAWCLTNFSAGRNDPDAIRNAEESRRQALLRQMDMLSQMSQKHEKMIASLLQKADRSAYEQRVCNAKVNVLTSSFQRMSRKLEIILNDVSQFRNIDTDYRTKVVDDNRSTQLKLNEVTTALTSVEQKVMAMSQNATHLERRLEERVQAVDVSVTQLNSTLMSISKTVEDVNHTFNGSSLENRLKITALERIVSSAQAIHHNSIRSSSLRCTQQITKVRKEILQQVINRNSDLASGIADKQKKIDQEMASIAFNLSSFNSRLNSMKNRTLVLIQKEMDRAKAEQWAKGRKSLCVGEECKYGTHGHNTMLNIHDALDTERADTLGMTDYALKSAGAKVHRHSETYKYGSQVVRIFGLPLYHDPTPPNVAITPGITPGLCWRMTGSQGYLVIKLAVAIQPTMVTLEHLDKKIDRYAKNDYYLAPKECEVYGWEDEDGKKKVRLGSFTYEREGSAIQTFSVKRRSPGASGIIWFRYVELNVLSNHGNAHSTCIYRFRVHGETSEWFAEHDDMF